MPKKTKKEKIIAEYHRRLQRVDSVSAPSASLPTYRYAPVVSQKTSSENGTRLSLATDDLSTITHDLTKTILWAALIIVIEVMLYWQVGR